MGFKKESIEKILNEFDKNMPGISKLEAIDLCFMKISEFSSNNSEIVI